MMSLNIDKSMLTPVIEKQVKMMMTEIMGGQDYIIDKVIETTLRTKVNYEGKITSYSDGKPLVEWLFTQQLQNAVRGVVQEVVDEKTEVIKRKVREALRRENNLDKIAQAVLDALAKDIKSSWNCDVKINIERRRDD